MGQGTRKNHEGKYLVNSRRQLGEFYYLAAASGQLRKREQLIPTKAQLQNKPFYIGLLGEVT
jgi:hypothetical protein